MLSCGTHVTSHVALASMCVRVHHQSRRSPRLTGRNAKRPSVLPPNFGTRTRQNRFTRSAVVSAPIHLGRIKASKASASFLEVSAHVRQRSSPYALREKDNASSLGLLWVTGKRRTRNKKKTRNMYHFSRIWDSLEKVSSIFGGFCLGTEVSSFLYPPLFYFIIFIFVYSESVVVRVWVPWPGQGLRGGQRK